MKKKISNEQVNESKRGLVVVGVLVLITLIFIVSMGFMFFSSNHIIIDKTSGVYDCNTHTYYPSDNLPQSMEKKYVPKNAVMIGC